MHAGSDGFCGDMLEASTLLLLTLAHQTPVLRLIKQGEHYRVEVYWTRGQAGVRQRGTEKHAYLATCSSMSLNIRICNFVVARLPKHDSMPSPPSLAQAAWLGSRRFDDRLSDELEDEVDRIIASDESENVSA